MVQCKHCGTEIVNAGIFVAFDHQKKEEVNFCSVEHLKSWVTKKFVWMCISLILGLIIVLSMLLDDWGAEAVMFLFIPYMIRQARHFLAEILDGGGWFGELMSFIIVLLGAITIVYPAYKLFREIKEYRYLKNKYSL